MMLLPVNQSMLDCRSNRMIDLRAGPFPADWAYEGHRHQAIGDRQFDDATGRQRQQKQQHE
jgi:hypothetical protein